MSTARLPMRANAALASALLALHGAVLLAAPLAQAPAAAKLALAAAAAVFSPTLWALIHEGIHGLLFARPETNARVARALSIAFGTPFRAVRYAHLRHHRYSRTPWGREEVYDPATEPAWRARIAHYARITFALYAGELLTLFACWLPRSWLRRGLEALCPDVADSTSGQATQAERALLEPAALREIRIDAALTLALYGSAFALYGADGWIVAAMLAVRGFLASQLDHAPHHGTPLDRRDYALNLSAPRWLRLFLLNFTLHRTHHQHPNLPWTALPRARESGATDISLVSAVLRQWRGPIALPDAQAIRLASEPK